MKIKKLLVVLTALSAPLLASISHADDITAVQSGNWSDTNTWDSGTVPGASDDADIPSGVNVTVDTNASIQFIYDGGTVTMGPNSSLDLFFDQAISPQTSLVTTAPNNTVIYSANAHDAKLQNYDNLVLNGLGTFYNVDPVNGPISLNVAGDLTLGGTNYVGLQAGADITIGGNLILGTNTSFDCSVARIMVQSNTIVSGFLLDGDGALVSGTGEVETNDFFGNVIINPSGTWNVSDVTQWAVGGSFTNYGIIKSKGFGSISFNGIGSIAGNAFQIKTITVNGTYNIGTTITLTTNTPTLNGTLVFDLANTNQIILNAGTNWLYYSGALNVINSGAAPTSGQSYQFFKANNYGGTFTSTSFPNLPGGLSWMNNLVASGSIAVIGGIVGSPTLILSRNGGQLTLSWNSVTYPGYSVQAQTNTTGIGSNWSPTGSGTNGSYTVTINPSNPSVFFRLSNP